MKLATVTIETPLGRYALVASEAGLVQAKPTGAAAPETGAANSGAERMLARARAAFERYFAGAADAFASLPIDPQGSEFQRRVWRALREIPVGAIASYGEIARKVGSPAAARAVGDANRRNPIAIAIPCHRVIGGDGSLVGYAGGLEDVELEDLLRDEATADPTVALERGEQAAALAGLLESLSPRERQVIDWRFGLSGGDEPSTLGEIGARLGLSRERVRQIEAAALMRLRASATGSCPSGPFDDAACASSQRFRSSPPA